MENAVASDGQTPLSDEPTVVPCAPRQRVSSELVVSDVLPAGQHQAAPRASGAFLTPVSTRVPTRVIAWPPRECCRTPQAPEDPSDAHAGTVLLSRDQRQEPTCAAQGTTSAVDAPDYVVVEHLASGGRGDVHLARQVALDRVVALKGVSAESDVDAREDFLREALVAASMDHPHIVTIHDVGLDQHGQPFYAMERARGDPWSERIDALPLATNVAILRRVALAIGHAHARGILHLDVKPANVLVEDPEGVTLIDWGMALALPGGFRGLVPPPPPTMRISGTPSYMAPELAAGAGIKVGSATDVYLLGATLYRAAAGRPPHTGSDLSACIAAAVANRPPPVTGADEELIGIIVRAMRSEPGRRYQQAEAFAAALGAWLEHQGARDLVRTGRQALRQALAGGAGYDAFHRAIFAFQTALERWPESPEAARWGSRARLALATHAYDRGDLELAEAQLSGDPACAALRTRIEQARERRRQAVRPQVAAPDPDVAAPCWSPVYTTADAADPIAGLEVVMGQEPVVTPAGIRLEGRSLHVTLLRQPVVGSLRLTCSCVLPRGGEFGFLIGLTGDPREQRSLTSGYEIKLGAYDGTEDLAIRQGERLWHRPAQPLRANEPHAVLLERLGTVLRLVVDGQEWFCLDDLHGPTGPDHGRVGILGWDNEVLLDRLEVAVYSERGRTEPYALATRLHVGGSYEAAAGVFAEIERTAVDPDLRRRAAAAHFRSTRARELRDGLEAIRTRLRASWPRAEVQPLEGGLDVLLDGAAVGDISPLAGLPIRRLAIYDRELRDLSPLIGAPLESASFNGSQVTDLSPLAGAPLRDLSIAYTPVEDLEPLSGAPLTMLFAAASRVHDLSPVAQERLQQVNVAGTPVRDLRPLHGLDLRHLVVAMTEVEDLTPLDGLPLLSLSCSVTAVADCSPLRHSRLRRLYMERTAIVDVEPLRALPLAVVDLSGSPVVDIAPLAHGGLTALSIDHTPIVSLSGLEVDLLSVSAQGFAFRELAGHASRRLGLVGELPPCLPGDPPLSAPWLTIEDGSVDLACLDLATTGSLVLTRCRVEHAERLLEHSFQALGLIQCQGIDDTVLAACRGQQHQLIIPAAYPPELCARLERAWQRDGLEDQLRLLTIGRAWADGDGDTLRALARPVAGGRWVEVADLMLWSEAVAGSARCGIPIATFDDLDQQRAVGRCGLPLDPFFRSDELGPWRWLSLADAYPAMWRNADDPCLSHTNGPAPVRSDDPYHPLLLRCG